MKKWLCALSICAVTGLGAFGFAGCGNGDDVASISIKSISNTQFQVGDVITPSLKDSIFTVTYKSGRTSDLPLSVADLVYIDYGDDTATDKFVIESRYQNIIVRYKDETTSYGVEVSRRDLNLNYKKTYTVDYNGKAQSARDAFDFVLPNDTYISKIEYKPLSSNNPADFTTTTPKEAGQYNLKVTISGGNQYYDKVIEDIVYEIAKADISFALNSTVQLNEITMQYGDKIDLNTIWTVGENTSAYFLTAFKTDFRSVADEIQFAYKSSADAEFKPVPQTDGEYDLSSLATDNYTLRAFAKNLANFKDFYFDSQLTIGIRQLAYGTDYKIVFVQGAQVYQYTPTDDLTKIQTTISTADPTSITVRVDFLNDLVKDSLDGSPQIFFHYSQNNNANWGGSMSAMQEYGYYKIDITANFKNGACTFGDTVFGVIVAKLAGD